MLSEDQQREVDLARKMINEDAARLLMGNEDWSPVLMNYIWNSMKSGEDYSKLIKFTESFGRDEDGKIGIWNSMVLYSAMKKVFKTENFTDALDYASELRRQSGLNLSDNAILWNCIDKFMKKEKRSGRIALSDYFLNFCTSAVYALMSEGLDDVRELLEKLSLISKRMYEDCFAVFVGLDERNIRGRQVMWGYEYCDRDLTTFVKYLESGSQEFLDYINVKASMYYKSFVPKAVSSKGTSLEEHLQMTPEEIKNFSSMDIKSAEVSYSTRDIFNGITIDEAIKILEGHGFELVYRGKITVLLDNFTDDDSENMIFYNKVTKAFACFYGAREYNSCYGGFDIIVPMKCYFSPVGDKNIFDYEINLAYEYENGEKVFVNRIVADLKMRAYRELVEVSSVVDDLTKLGYNLHNGIPLPSLYKAYDSGYSRSFKDRNIETYCLLNRSYHFFLYNFLNTLTAPSLIKGMEDKFQFIYEPYLRDIYTKALEVSYFTNDVKGNSVMAGVAFNVLGIPDNEIDRYYNAILSKDSSDFVKESLKYLYTDEGKLDFYGKSDIVMLFMDEFNLECKNSGRPSVTKVKTKSKLDDMLKKLRRVIKSQGGEGIWVLYESEGKIYLKGDRGSLVLEDTSVKVKGILKGCGKELSKEVKNLIRLMLKDIKIPIKSLSFGLNFKSKDFKMRESTKELGSYDIFIK